MPFHHEDEDEDDHEQGPLIRENLQHLPLKQGEEQALIRSPADFVEPVSDERLACCLLKSNELAIRKARATGKSQCPMTAMNNS